MKKLLLAAIAVLIVFWIGTLFLISNPLTISSVAFIKAPATKVNSFVQDTATWPEWWPTQLSQKYRYSVLSQSAFSTKLLANSGSDTFTSELIVLPATPDSAILHWTVVQAASSNPFTRLRQYNRAKDIRQYLQLVLDSLTAYMQNKKKIYGLDISVSRFTNPFMLNTKAQFAHYPTTDEVYASIQKLRAYASAGKAVVVDSPMVNVLQTEGSYLLRTALPVDKQLTSNNSIDFKQMVLGNTLTGSVTGGRQQVEKSLKGIEDFISDYRLSSPAIPFQVWQTNRQQQPDSSKWITRLYYPIY